MWSRSQESDPAIDRAFGTGWRSGFYGTEQPIPLDWSAGQLRAYEDGIGCGMDALEQGGWFKERGYKKETV